MFYFLIIPDFCSCLRGKCIPSVKATPSLAQHLLRVSGPSHILTCVHNGGDMVKRAGKGRPWGLLARSLGQSPPPQRRRHTAGPYSPAPQGRLTLTSNLLPTSVHQFSSLAGLFLSPFALASSLHLRNMFTFSPS